MATQTQQLSLHDRTLVRFPKGVFSRMYIPVMLDGQAFELRIFTEARRHAIEFGLFLASRRYARKTLVVRRDGRVHFDDEGTIPDIDRHDVDATFAPTLEQVLAIVEDAVTNGKPTCSAH